MAAIVKVQDGGSELTGYLGTLVKAETHYQEAVEIKQALLAADRKAAHQLRPEPVKGKAIIRWIVVVPLVVAGLIFMDVSKLVMLAFFAAAIFYIHTRINLRDNAYQKDVELWNEEKAQNERWRTYLALKIREINRLIDSCAKTLDMLYNVGPLHPDYQNLPACATFYDWVSKGMTFSLSRNGSDPGAYVMYEEKLRHGELMNQLSDIRASINEIRDTQARLYQAVCEINQTVKTISHQLIGIQATAMRTAENTEAIKANTEQIKNNTATAAYYAKVNAENAEALNKYVGAR